MNSTAYAQLTEHFATVKKLAAILATLEWDQQTMLPVKGSEYRAEQIEMLAGMVHQQKTDPRIPDWLEQVEAECNQNGTADPNVTANVKEIRRQFEKNSKLPESLVKELAKCAALGQQVWVEARKNDDFKKFEPCLQQMMELKRQEADAIGFEECRYDALLDDYEPGARTSEVAEVLNRLKQDLVPLVQKISESGKKTPTEILQREYPTQQQEQFTKYASQAIGFDYERGRLDQTHHPFCTELGPNDVRITTRYDERFFNPAFFGTLHEAGHGMYEQGLRADQYGLPTGSYCSLGIHESQSRMWENNVGRSLAFWKFMLPRAQQHFTVLADIGAEQFYEAVNDVRPSLIRVEADEATYNLHIIIRFELEQALLNDELPVADLPETWNQMYQDNLGIEPSSDSKGVLQDIHWSAGLVGYFPTYSLGNLYSCQFFDVAERELGDQRGNFERGHFGELLAWLRTHVHQPGAGMTSRELLQSVTGQGIDHQSLITYLHNKLAPIYGI